MRDDVTALIADSGPLLRATGIEAAPNRYSELALEFASGVLYLRCNDDTDEVIVAADGSNADHEVISDPPLSELDGMALAEAWLLTNHRSYCDGFQIRFRDADRKETTLQFEVGASAMDIRRVT